MKDETSQPGPLEIEYSITRLTYHNLTAEMRQNINSVIFLTDKVNCERILIRRIQNGIKRLTIISIRNTLV